MAPSPRSSPGIRQPGCLAPPAPPLRWLMPRANGLLSCLGEKERAVFDGIYHCHLNVVVHAARREFDTSLFNTQHGANVLTVRALHFHILFDVRSFDHNG